MRYWRHKLDGWPRHCLRRSARCTDSLEPRQRHVAAQRGKLGPVCRQGWRAGRRGGCGYVRKKEGVATKTISHEKAQKAQDKIRALPHFPFVLFVPFCG